MGGYENILELVPMPVCIPLTSHRLVHHEGLSGQCGNHNVWLLPSSPPPQGRPQFPCGTGRGAFNTAPLLRGSELETLPSPCSTPWAIWPEQTPLPLWASVSASVQWTHDHTRLTAFMFSLKKTKQLHNGCRIQELTSPCSAPGTMNIPLPYPAPAWH